MVKSVAIAKRIMGSWKRGWGLKALVVSGLLGIVICGYGYAAQGTSLLIEGRAIVWGSTDVRNTGVRVESKSDNAGEAYNAEFTVHSASLYPDVNGKGEEITYAITTCNFSKTKTFELVGLDEPATSVGSLETKITGVEVGTAIGLGTLLAPGECVDTLVSFVQPVNGSAVGAMTLDYKWVEYNGVPFSIDYMQDMTPQVCAAASTRETKQLEDKRDGKKYWVTKMHDGNCWMAQDMDYDGGGDIRYTRAEVDALQWDNDGTSSPAQYMYNGDNEKGHESDGSYYSYMAAMSVCPTGWRLATGGVGGEWDKLLDVAGLKELGNSGSSSWSDWWERAEKAPFYLNRSGYVDGAKGLREYGSMRTGWTLTRSGARPNTSLAIGWGDGYPQQKYFIDWDDTNFYGEPARCIAKTGNETQVKELLTIDTMQEMTADVCAVSQEGDSKQLIDDRDGKKYWVTKLKDGQCWMTQNLDYDGGGTRFDKNSDLSKWISEAHSNPAQYYYNGDNDVGRRSDGSYYSYKAALNVCPAGWRLPTGGLGGDFNNLFGGNSLGTTVAARRAAVLKNPYFFWASGYLDSDGFKAYNKESDYRAARRAGDSKLTTMSHTPTAFNTVAGDDFYYGESVRCVYGDPAQEPQDIFTVDAMQDLTSQICMNTTLYGEDVRRLLTDTRDGHRYWVTRMAADDNCWMVQNLDYDGGGTRFDENSDATKWIMDATKKPKQYYYRGDWEDGLTSYGTLYSWYAAQDACPAGWRLPTGGANSEETKLWSGVAASTAGLNKLKAAPFYYVTSGYYENSGLRNEGKEGYWWSGTESASGGYVMSITTSKPYVRPYIDEGGYWGESVRCLVR